MNLLAIVPCRMGDSEIPNKCTREDTPDGMSLLTKAMHFAHELTDYVLVTTPRQPPVLPLKRIYWRERPESLCGPDVPMRDVVNDALDYWHFAGEPQPDRWVLLQPTTPSRTLAEVKRVLGVRHGVQGVTCSVEKVPQDYSPDRLLFQAMNELDRMMPFFADPAGRQFARTAYRRNGLAYVGSGLWEADTPLYGVITDHHPTLDTQADWNAFVGFSPQLVGEPLHTWFQRLKHESDTLNT